MRRYGLEPIPESVKRLTELVAKQDEGMDEIAEIVRSDKALTARLLRAANPRASRPEDYDITTVHDALMRNGLRAFFILAMGDPITRAVGKTLRHMLGVEKVGMVNPNSVPGLDGDHLIGEVEFKGQACGAVHLRMTMDTARFIAGRLLNVEDLAELKDQQEVMDALGEMVNIVCGNFHSNLRDAGFDCKLCPPRISQTDQFRIRSVPGGCSERMAFVTPELSFFVDLSVNPWGD